MSQSLTSEQVAILREAYASRLLEQEPLAAYTSVRIGGPADFLLKVESAEELEAASRKAWSAGISFRLIGGGCNLLVSDRGARGLVILNRARQVDLIEDDRGCRLRAESGATMGIAARKAVRNGWGGLEWAATVPGSIGGAVVNNAGAFGGSMQADLIVAEILQQDGQVEAWTSSQMAYAYRKSALKQNPGPVVLAAELAVQPSTPEECKQKMEAFLARRKETQPPGASMGSTFMNPQGDFAGRLLEAAGLKGSKSGPVEISTVHANFILNSGGGKAADVLDLIRRMKTAVAKKFGVVLKLEIEMFGDWEQKDLMSLEVAVEG
ncbi:MAG: UDP-N-acetylmuramate dehydrogenase [Anaerolineales bacterium]|nr:UDP-N-acetylmuramate dehydrogenase [Anaerolineales bacterium]